MNVIYFNQRYFSDNASYENDGKVLLIPEPWLLYCNRFIRFLSHIHLSPRINSHLELPFKSIWIKNILKKSFTSNEKLCIVINSHFYNLYYDGIIKIAKKYFPDVYFAFIFSDRVTFFKKFYKDFPDIDLLKKDFDLVITYNVEDAKKYNIILDRPCFPIYKKLSNKLHDYSSDVFFVGSEKGRLKQIYDVYEVCKKHKLKCDFYINNVPEEKQKYRDEITYNTKLDYDEVLERVSKTKCVLNIIQDGGAGITLRDYEALYFNKLSLTNNYALVETELYDDNQIIWLNEFEKKIYKIKSFKNRTSNLLLEKYSLKKWCEWIELMLDK